MADGDGRSLRAMKRLLLLAALLAGACAAPPGVTPQPVSLVYYSTLTPAPVDFGLAGLVTAAVPLPSPTPFTYTVQAGDTMGGVALKFGVKLEDLQAANPQISPNTMSIGQVLRIPSDPANPSGEPTPVPAPLEIQQIGCYPGGGSNMWCFVLAHNPSSDLYENVSAHVTLVSAAGETITSGTALLLLNILPPGASLPLAVHFTSGIPADAQPRAQVLTAIRLLPGEARYLPAFVRNVVTRVDWNGRSARVSGQVGLPAESKAAGTVWVAATAYDASGHVVGWRRWEGSGLQPGGSLPFELQVFSLAGPVDRVDLAVEARP